MSIKYRKHYNQVYKLWELQKSGKSLIDTDIWITLTYRETEAEIDVELAKVTQ